MFVQTNKPSCEETALKNAQIINSDATMSGDFAGFCTFASLVRAYFCNKEVIQAIRRFKSTQFYKDHKENYWEQDKFKEALNYSSPPWRSLEEKFIRILLDNSNDNGELVTETHPTSNVLQYKKDNKYISINRMSVIGKLLQDIVDLADNTYTLGDMGLLINAAGYASRILLGDDVIIFPETILTCNKETKYCSGLNDAKIQNGDTFIIGGKWRNCNPPPTAHVYTVVYWNGYYYPIGASALKDQRFTRLVDVVIADRYNIGAKEYDVTRMAARNVYGQDVFLFCDFKFLGEEAPMEESKVKPRFQGFSIPRLTHEDNFYNLSDEDQKLNAISTCEKFSINNVCYVPATNNSGVNQISANINNSSQSIVDVKKDAQPCRSVVEESYKIPQVYQNIKNNNIENQQIKPIIPIVSKPSPIVTKLPENYNVPVIKNYAVPVIKNNAVLLPANYTVPVIKNPTISTAVVPTKNMETDDINVSKVITSNNYANPKTPVKQTVYLTNPQPCNVIKSGTQTYNYSYPKIIDCSYPKIYYKPSYSLYSRSNWRGPYHCCKLTSNSPFSGIYIQSAIYNRPLEHFKGYEPKIYRPKRGL